MFSVRSAQKVMLLSVFALISSSVFAITNDELAQTCLGTGVEKIVEQAKAYHCHINSDEVRVTGIENHVTIPVKYLWYSVSTKCAPEGRIQKLVQYTDGYCH